MRKLMKSIFMGAAMLALPMMLTSCEGTLDDVFGQWDRPSKIPAEVFMFKKVLDEGATLTVSFKLNDSDASVTFKKEGDTYKVTSSTLSAENFSFERADVEDEDIMVMTYEEGGKCIGQIFFKVKDGSYFILNNIDGNVTFDGKVSVNGLSGSVTNNCPDKTEIGIDDDNPSDNISDNTLIVYYNKANGETWKDVVKRYRLDFRLGSLLYSAADNKDYKPDIEAATKVGISINGYNLVKYGFEDDAVGINDIIGEQGGDIFDGPYAANCPSAIFILG